MFKRVGARVVAMLAAVSALAACAGDQPSSPEATSPVSTTTTQDSRFDTGVYSTAPRSWGAPTEEELRVNEVIGYNANSVFPHEVDPALDIRKSMVGTYNLHDLHHVLDEEVVDLLTPFSDKLVAANGLMTTDFEGDRFGLQVLLRFDNPDVAKEAAAAIVTHDREHGRHYALAPFQPVAIPEHPEVEATEIGPLITAVTTRNEYLVYAAAENKIHYPPWLSPLFIDPASPDIWWNDTSWQPGFLSTYFTFQLPGIDQTQARKTVDGYGASEDWNRFELPDMEPYLVLVREGQRPGGLPPRAVVPHFRHVRQHQEALEKANVDAALVETAYMYRTPDPQKAEALAEDLINIVLFEEGFEVGYEEYDEPQAVPGTRCTSLQTTEGRWYYCVQQYGRYVVTSNEYVATDTADNETGKTTLSQRMAAQYLLFEQMPDAQL